MITASIVVYHTPWSELEKVLGCVMRSPIDKLWVIDHGDDKALIENLRDYPFAEYVPHPNLGYGSGHNVALRRAIKDGALYHAVLNPDIWWKDPVIEELAAYMDLHEDVAQMMPKIFYPDGSLQYQCKLLPRPIDLILRGFLPKKFGIKMRRRFQLEDWSYDAIANIPYLNGCFMFFRVAALKEVGLFDERFFMYPEDIDITRRLHQHYLTLFYPFVSITHVLASESKRNSKLRKIHIINMIKYFNKWGWIFDKFRCQANRRLLQELNLK